MYIITDGKRYVMNDPFNANNYIHCTSKIKASEYSLSTAKKIIETKFKENKKYDSWRNRGFKIIDLETQESVNLNYEGKADIHMKTYLDDSLTSKIIDERNSIMGLAGWSINELSSMKDKLCDELSYYDSAISDISHIIEKKDDYKMAAHTMTKIMNEQSELQKKRRNTKVCQQYVSVLIDSINNKYTIDRIKTELEKIKIEEYKKRTPEYDKIMNMIEEDRSKLGRKPKIIQKVEKPA